MNLSPRSFLVSFVRASLLAATLPARALAQSAPARPAGDNVQLETFTVTGSNLRRLDQEKVLPVTIVDRDFIETRGASSPVELLVALPQVVSVPLNESAISGADARGDHASISLRGLPSGDTLVLLNGRRVVPHPISPTEASVPALSVNVNQLPVKGLDRIEVLRDGASSVYGSDAVAGVVNTFVRRDYRGTELTARYGLPEHGGGIEKRITGVYGRDFANDRGHWVTVFDVFNRGAVFARDRSLTKDQDHRSLAPAPWNGSVPNNLNFFGRTALSFFGNYNLGTVAPNATFTATRPAGIPANLATAAGLTFIVPTAAGVGFKTTTPDRVGVERDYYINANAYRTLQPTSTRYNIHSQIERSFGGSLTAFGELGYYRARSEAYREPDSVSRAADGNIIVAADNPWNPFGSRFFNPTGAPNADGSPRLPGTPAAVRIESKRFIDFGQRIADVDSQVFRLLGGVRGKLGDTWDWETAALGSQADTTDREKGATRSSLFAQTLARTDPARAYNPFGHRFAVQNGTVVATTPYTNPRSIIDEFQQDFVRDGRTRLGSVDVRATNNALFEFWQNRLGLAVGAEFRYESLDDVRPPFAGLNPPGSGLDSSDNDFLAVSPNPDTHANRKIKAAYAELVVPLVGRAHAVPLVQSLELTLAGRFESYSDFGQTTKPKFGLNWKPLRSVMLRGSYNEGFRAPNLAQLFAGDFIRTNTTTDSYRSLVTGLPNDGAFSRIERRGGNRSLQPEEARGKSAGIVLEVPNIKGLTLSADYWTIKTSNVIGVSGSVDDDRDRLVAETQLLLAGGTAINTIDLSGRGDPAIVRLPLTADDRAAFATYNTGRPASQQRGAIGAIDYLRVTFFNKAAQTVSGLDFDATWQSPSSHLGRLTLGTAWSYLLEFDEIQKAGAAVRDRRWLDGNAKWRGNLNVTWRRASWMTGVNGRYIGSFQSSVATTDAATYQALGAPTYIAARAGPDGLTLYRYIVRDSVMFNAFVAYTYKGQGRLNDTTLRLSVNNAFDRNPPLSPNALGFEPAVYEARGRIWAIDLTKRF